MNYREQIHKIKMEIIEMHYMQLHCTDDDYQDFISQLNTLQQMADKIEPRIEIGKLSDSDIAKLINFDVLNYANRKSAIAAYQELFAEIVLSNVTIE